MWLTALTLAVMLVLAGLANVRFSAKDQLPMQFGPTGQVGWSAPRLFALGFMPALSAIMMIPAALLTDDPIVILVMTVSCVLGQLMHLWLIDRHLRK